MTLSASIINLDLEKTDRDKRDTQGTWSGTVYPTQAFDLAVY